MERGKFGSLLILRVSMETLDEPVYPNIIVMFGDDGCGPGEQSLGTNVSFQNRLMYFRCPLAHFLAYFRLWANVKHTQLAISTVEHVEGGWDYAQII